MLPVLTCRWLSQSGYNEELTKGALSCLHSLCAHGHSLDRIPEDQFRTLNTQLLSWLLHASRNSLTTPSSGISLFSLSGASKKQVQDSVTLCIWLYTYLNLRMCTYMQNVHSTRGLWCYMYVCFWRKLHFVETCTNILWILYNRSSLLFSCYQWRRLMGLCLKTYSLCWTLVC